jgi:competence protein ComEA
MNFTRLLMLSIAVLALNNPVSAATSHSTSANQAIKAGALAKASNAAVNINTASMQELLQVPGMTANKAKSLLTFRKKNGNFQTVEDLRKVSGFKRMSTTQWEEWLTKLTVA